MIVDQVEIAVGEDKPDVDLGPSGKKLGDDGEDMQPAKDHRRGDDELAARRGMFPGRRALGLIHFIEDALGRGDIGRARIGESEPAGRAGQEPRAQMRFEFGNLAADRRQRHAKFAAGGGQAAGLRNRDQKGHGFKAVHVSKTERLYSDNARLLDGLKDTSFAIDGPILAGTAWSAPHALWIS